MNFLSIRLAEPKDDSAVGELLVDAFVSAYGKKLPQIVVSEERKKDLRDVATKRMLCDVLVAELIDSHGSSEIVGTVVVCGPQSTYAKAWLPNAAFIKQMATHPKCHGRGFAKQLLDAAEQTARSWNVDAICVQVRREASGIIEIYKRRGYENDSRGNFDSSELNLDGLALKCSNKN